MNNSNIGSGPNIPPNVSNILVGQLMSRVRCCKQGLFGIGKNNEQS